MTYGSNARVVVPGTASFRQATRYDDAEEDTLSAADRMALFDRLTNFNRHYNSGCTQHDIDEFSADWRLLLRADFTIKEMGEIFRAVSDALIQADWDNPDFYKGVKKIILKNWAEWEEDVLRKIPRSLTKDVICLYAGCARLRIKPSDEFLNIVHDIVARSINALKPPHFNSYLITAAFLKSPPPLHHVSRICRGISSFLQNPRNNQDGYRLFWAMAMLNSLTGNNAYRKLAESIPLSNMQDMPISWQKMVYDAYTWFGRNSPIPNPRREVPTTSHTEMLLRAAFEEHGYKTRQGVFVTTFPKAVDFCSETPDGDLWIECDGPNHFLDNPMGKSFAHVYDGKTLFRASLIQRVNNVGRILHVPFNVTRFNLLNAMGYDAKKSLVDFLASATKHMPHGTTALADLRYDGEHIDMLMMPLEPGKGIGAPFAQMRVR